LIAARFKYFLRAAFTHVHGAPTFSRTSPAGDQAKLLSKDEARRIAADTVRSLSE
jgi:hypothetical protein